jgi:nickel superoxide dismutase
MNKTISKLNKTAIVAMLFTLFLSSQVYGHCEIPCGIYGDSLRIAMIQEHISTVEKSMKQINLLSQESPVNYNQLVRWVTNKEEHATKIQDIVSQYFLHQRIKLTAADSDKYDHYITNLTLLHQLLVYSMKAKQSTDLDIIGKMKETVASFEEIYFQQH